MSQAHLPHSTDRLRCIMANVPCHAIPCLRCCRYKSQCSRFPPICRRIQLRASIGATKGAKLTPRGLHSWLALSYWYATLPCRTRYLLDNCMVYTAVGILICLQGQLYDMCGFKRPTVPVARRVPILGLRRPRGRRTATTGTRRANVRVKAAKLINPPPNMRLRPLRSEHNLLTSGGGVIKLWSVVTAAAKQLPSQGNPSVDGEGAYSVLQHKHVWRQPMQKVLFAPVGQVGQQHLHGPRAHQNLLSFPPSLRAFYPFSAAPLFFGKTTWT